MPDESNTVVQPSAPASEGAPVETKAAAPVAAIPSLDEETLRRVVQSQTDKAVKAQTRRLEAQLDDVADQLRALSGSIVEAAPDERREAVAAKASQVSQSSGAIRDAMVVIDATLKANGLDAEDDLGLPVGDIARSMNKGAFDALVARAIARKGSATPSKAPDAITELKAQINDLSLKLAQATGAATVPVGGGTVAGRRERLTPDDWTPEDVEKELRKMGLSDSR
jgi:hypothetical protein